MAETEWIESTDSEGRDWLTINLSQIKVCLSEDGVFWAVGAPAGGIASYPALAKGEPGFPSSYAAPILHMLEPGDPTADALVQTLVSPATSTAGPVYRWDVWLHKPQKGDTGSTVINPTDYGTPAYKQLLQVNSALTGFELVAPKVGGMAWPTTVTEAPAGSTTSQTLATVAFSPKPFAWWPRVSGVSVVSASTSDVRVDLVARLGGTGGPAVGRCPGLAGTVDRLILPSGPDTGASPSATQVAANTAATVVFVTEKQAGIGTYQTGVVAASRFSVEAVPVP